MRSGSGGAKDQAMEMWKAEGFMLEEVEGEGEV